MSVDTADCTCIGTLLGERSAIVLAPEWSYLGESYALRPRVARQGLARLPEQQGELMRGLVVDDSRPRRSIPQPAMLGLRPQGVPS